MRIIITILLSVFFLFCVPPVIASEPLVVLTDSFDQRGIRGDYLGIFEDPQKKLTIDEVSAPGFQKNYASIGREVPANKNTSSAYWLRFTITNQGSSSKKWLIEMYDHNINYISFYVPDSAGRYQAQLTGNLRPFSTRLFAHKNFEFDLPVRIGDTLTFYMRIESENDNVIMPEIRSYKKFIDYALQEYHFLGLFYGILLMIVIYNLLIITAIPKISYIYYILYVLSFALYSMCETGLSFQFLWPENYALNRFVFAISLFGIIFFSMLFTKSFLNLKNQLPVLNRIINWVLLLRGLLLVAGLLFYKKLLSVMYLDISLLCIAFAGGIICYYRGDRSSKYVIFAYSSLFFAFLVSALEHYGWIRSDIATVYSTNMGVMLDIIFLSMSLADRVRTEIRMKEEAQQKVLEEMREKELLKDKVNKELEGKVAERTLQLSNALQKLEKQAEEINRINLVLDLANRDLKKDVKEIARTRIMKTHVDFDEFIKVYPDDLSCYRFIEELKNERGFVCKKCQSASAGKGKDVFDRRCNRCGYNESITANTIFHKLKFSIVKAFYIMYLVTTRKDITAEELSNLLAMRKSTCSTLKKKIQDRLNKRDKKDVQSWDVLILDDETETLLEEAE